MQVALAHFVLHSQRRGARNRMSVVRMLMHDDVRSGLDRLVHLVGNEQRAERQISGAQSLRERDEVRRDPLVLARVTPAGAAHPAHDFVEDEQHAVAVADLADALEITGRGRDAAKRRADYGLGDEGGNVGRPELENLRFELVSRSPRRSPRRFRLRVALDTR